MNNMNKKTDKELAQIYLDAYQVWKSDKGSLNKEDMELALQSFEVGQLAMKCLRKRLYEKHLSEMDGVVKVEDVNNKGKT